MQSVLHKLDASNPGHHIPDEDFIHEVEQRLLFSDLCVSTIHGTGYPVIVT